MDKYYDAVVRMKSCHYVHRFAMLGAVCCSSEAGLESCNSNWRRYFGRRRGAVVGSALRQGRREHIIALVSTGCSFAVTCAGLLIGHLCCAPLVTASLTEPVE